MTYSYTQISQYLSCPRRYKHRYLDGWKEKDSRAAMLFGRAFEQALAAYFRRQDAAAVLFREWSAHRESIPRSCSHSCRVVGKRQVCVHYPAPTMRRELAAIRRLQSIETASPKSDLAPTLQDRKASANPWEYHAEDANSRRANVPSRNFNIGLSMILQDNSAAKNAPRMPQGNWNFPRNNCCHR